MILDKYLKQVEFSSMEDFRQHLEFIIPEHFNFGYDVVDAWAAQQPGKRALCWTNDQGEHKEYTFADIKHYSDQTASFFQRLGIGRGDQVMLILTVAHPATATTFIDRFLATAEAYRVPAVLVINKMDIYTDDEKRYADDLAYLYRYIGYPVHLISVKNGEGLDGLRDLLKGKTTLLAGNSGVGKSTLLNCLVPYANAKTAEISDTHDQGMHTTTFSEMYEMIDDDSTKGYWQSKGHDNTYLIDTPGIRGFGTIEFEKETVGHYFPEIFRISAECRFGNCTHTHEPGCAVLTALQEHRISQSRYDSYLSILDDEDEGKYRE